MKFPPIRRIVTALIAAATAAAWPSYLIALLTLPARPTAALQFVALGLGVALAHAVLLGLPFYLLTAGRGPPRLRLTTIGGGLIGALPIAIWTTATGAPAAILPTLYFAFCGMVGGAVFDSVVTRSPIQHSGRYEKGGPLPDRPFDLPEPEA